VSDLTPMQPSNDKTRTRKRIDALERLVRKLAAAPIRNATIDGPVVVSHRGAVTATSEHGSITSLSPDGVTSVTEDGKTLVVAEGDVLVQEAPGEPWLRLDQGSINAAAEALQAAQTAQGTADDKSTIVRSPDDAPSGAQPAFKAGDEWRKVDGGFVTAVWQHDGTQFVSQVLEGTMLSADAIDGKTVTGATVQTSADSARGVKFFNAGIVGYDSAGVPKTVIDVTTGAITAVDGTFTGTVAGSSFVGGAIAIAEGVTGSFAQDWETATGTTPPSGWTRSVLASAGSGGGVDFPTGGNPGRCVRLTSATSVPVLGFNSQVLFNPSIVGQDFDVSFDYKRSSSGSGGTDHTLILRGDSTHLFAGQPDGAVRIVLSYGDVRVYDGSAYYDNYTVPKAAPDTWFRYRVILRGQTLTITRSDMSGNLAATYQFTLGTASRTGLLAWMAQTDYGTAQQASTVLIDNMTAAVLKTGFRVGTDGRTDVEQLVVGGAASGPDPLMPNDFATKLYADSIKSRAVHTGTQLASTISDIDTRVRTSRIDQMAIPTAPVNHNMQRLYSVADGTATNDAINKGQFDAGPVATTAAVTYNTGWSDLTGTETTQVEKSGRMVAFFLAAAKSSSVAGELICTIPVGYRPRRTTRVTGNNNGSIRSVTITPNGEVRNDVAQAAPNAAMIGSGSWFVP
jgi:hypothetical protein